MDLGYGVLFTIAPESFPTDIRSSAIALASVISRLGGISSLILTGFLLEFDYGYSLAIGLYSGFYLLCAVFVLFYFKETRIRKKINSDSLL